MVLKSFPSLKDKGKLSLSPQEINQTEEAQHGKGHLSIDFNERNSSKFEIIQSEGDSTTTSMVTPSSRNGRKNSPFTESMNMMFRLVILTSLILGFGFNFPFKRYFGRKRKGKNVSPQLYRFCRRFLLKTPLINAGIVLLAFTVMHVIMFIRTQSPEMFTDELERRLYTNYLFISLVASLLSILFIYFWQKHLVHIRYIEFVYSRDELQKRIFRKNSGKIRNRLYIASAMTTLLPLTIVMLYLLLSLTPIRDMGDVSTGELRIMMGRYSRAGC